MTAPRRRAAADDLPFVLAAGERLFGETSDKRPMRLVDTRTVGDGPVFLADQPVRDA